MIGKWIFRRLRSQTEQPWGTASLSVPSVLWSCFAFLTLLLCFFPSNMALSQQVENPPWAGWPVSDGCLDVGAFEDDGLSGCLDDPGWGACFVPSSEQGPPVEIYEGDGSDLLQCEDDIVNFYPVKSDAVFAYIGGVDVIRPDSSNRKGLWHGILLDDEAEKYGPDHRLLIVYGDNLLEILDGDPVIRGVNSDSEYEILEIAPTNWIDIQNSPYFRIWSDFYKNLTQGNWEDEQTLREIEKFLVMAKLPGGKFAGIERFQINAIEGKWVLRKGNVTADLSIIRVPIFPDQNSPAQKRPDILNYFFTSDRIMVEVRLSDQVELDEVPVVLRVDNKIVKIDAKKELMAIPVPGVPGLYRTPVLTRVESNGSGRVGSDAKKLPMGVGGILSATLPRAASMTMRFPGAAMFQPTPDAIGNHWKSRVREVAVIADKLDLYNADPNAFLRRKVGEVSFTHATGSETININAGDHAALLILRQSFVDQMKPVYKELSELDAQLGDDPFLLNSFYQSAKRQIDNPNFPFQHIKVDDPVESLITLQVSYRNAFDENFLDRKFDRYWGRAKWIEKVSRQAFDQYLAATKFAIDHADAIEDDDFEELLQLVSVGFEAVAQRTVPNIVELSTSAPLRWMPDRVARGYVAGVNAMGKRYRANKELTRAEVSIAIAAAIPFIFFPVSVPLQIAATGLSVAFVTEALIYEVPEAFASRREAQLALGAVTLLGPDRIKLAQSLRVPRGVEALVVLGSMIGLGADFVFLVHSVKLSRIIPAGTRALDLMETRGFQAFAHLSEEEQIAIAAMMQEARNVKMVDPSQLTRLQRRALDASRRIGDGAEHIRELRLRDRLLAGGHRTGKHYKFKTGRAGGIPPPTLEQGAIVAGMPIGREIGVGSNARVYELVGPDGKVIDDRVLKIFKWGEDGEEVVERSMYVARVLEEKGVPQLKILGRGTEDGTPFLVQERLAKSQHTYEVVSQTQKITDVDGPDFVGGYSGLREFSRLDPVDPSKLLLRKLPRPLQRAYFRLLGEVNDPGTGRAAMIWEDAHLENVYFEQVGRHEWRAGILDQDRLLPWGAPLPANHPMHKIQDEFVDLSQLLPKRFRIFSLVNAKMPMPGDRIFDIMSETGAFYPSGRFYQAKLLESKGFFVFEPATNTWSSRIVDMDIVDEFFPRLREWANFDFHAYHGGG